MLVGRSDKSLMVFHFSPGHDADDICHNTLFLSTNTIEDPRYTRQAGRYTEPVESRFEDSIGGTGRTIYNNQKLFAVNFIEVINE